MIRLRTLGSIGLTADSGDDLAPVLRQPKRLALFLYLALASPRGFQRRDSLLALFWPELDEEHARASLRQSLYTLRRQLPDGVLRNRGDGEVAVSAEVVWSDVQAFEERIAEGRPEAALELYRGPLLRGFHVPDASPELDYWIEAERARLQDLALSAASEAREAAEARGDLDGAVRWAARAVELSPLDEEAARREITLRHQAGDRSGALLAYEQMAARLDAELGLEPDPATLDLVERVRTEPVPTHSRSARPREVPPPPLPTRTVPANGDSGGEGAAAAVIPPAMSPVAPVGARDPERGRRRVLAGLATGLVMAALIALLPIRLDWRDGAAAPAGSRVMVLPFSYRGSGESDYLAEGLVYLFSVALDGHDLRAVDPHGMLRRAGSGGGRDHDLESAAALASETGVAYFVLGSVVETGGGLRVTAALYERGQRVPAAQASATGSASQVLELVDALAGEMLTTLAGSPSSRITRLAAVTSHSLPALKAYLAGERLMRQGQHEAAIESFEEAVAEDSAFALAHYRTSEAASWAFRGALSTRAAAAAARHAERLPERERRLLAGHEAYRRGEAARAIEQLQDLTLLYPDDPEAWYRLGEARVHFGPLHGSQITEAREPFTRVLELGERHTDAVYHLAQLAALDGDTASALAYVRMGLEAAPQSSRAPQLRLLRSCLEPGGEWRDRVAELRAEDDFTVVSSAYNAAVYARRLDRAHQVATLLTAASRPEATRAFGRLLLAELELARGRHRAAQVHLAELEALDPARVDQYRALLAAAPPAQAHDPGALGSVLERLQRGIERPLEEPAPPATIFRPDDRYGDLPRLYAAGTAAALLEDDGALELATRGLAEHGVFGADLGEDLRLLAAQQGNGSAPASAPPRFEHPVEEVVLSPFLSRPSRRFIEARRLESTGRLREALVWYESLAVFSIHDLPWGIPALLDRARIHERLGEPERAAALYVRFAELWEDADDPAPRREALAQLARLGKQDR